MKTILLQTGASSGLNGPTFLILILFFIIVLLIRLDKYKTKLKREQIQKMGDFELKNQIIKRSTVYLCWFIGIHHFYLGKWYLGIPYFGLIFFGWVFTILFAPLGLAILTYMMVWAVVDLFLINMVVNKRNAIVYSEIRKRGL